MQPKASASHREVRRVWTRDPTGFLVSVAAWSAFTAATLLAPGRVFAANPIYRAIRRLPLPEGAWGGMMLLVAGLLLAGLVRPSVGPRLLACVSAAALWVFYGSMLLLGGLLPDEGAGPVLFSAGGAYGLFIGLCCALAAAQWAHHTPREGAPEGASGGESEGRAPGQDGSAELLPPWTP